jgi:lysophospholipase L1-like esterase
MPIDAPNGSAGFFADWNAVIEDAVSTHQQQLIDIHDHFTGHGVNTPPSWYASDCVHPNSVGHAEISELVFGQITGT